MKENSVDTTALAIDRFDAIQCGQVCLRGRSQGKTSQQPREVPKSKPEESAGSAPPAITMELFAAARPPASSSDEKIAAEATGRSPLSDG